MALTQEEIDQLFSIKKFPVESITIDFPLQGESISIELQNETKRIRFDADINRANSIVDKVTYQLRHKKIYSIRRLDLKGNHTNPPAPAPDAIFEGFEEHVFKREDHIHFYMEGYGERWALPLSAIPAIGITQSDNLYERMTKFFKYCNVEYLNINKVPLF